MSRKIIDLTGKKFGYLTVLSRGEDYIYPNGKSRPRWNCLCQCGNTTLVQSGALTSNKTKSCGCLRSDLIRDRVSSSNIQKRVDITNIRFGRLVAEYPVETKKNVGCLWLCKCDCGNDTIVPAKRLRAGKVKSCGCLRNDNITELNRIHGKSHKSRLYNVWIGMRQRCNDPNHKSYANYGGRGIKVCTEWDEFGAFEKWAIENGYDADAPYGECTIDRIEVNGDYEPSNCRWADSKTQANNKRARK